MITAAETPRFKERRVEDQRLKRVEEKVDGVIDTLRDLVAVQRDIHHILDRVARVEHENDVLAEKVAKVTTAEAQSSSSSGTFEKMMLVVLAGGLGVLGSVVVSGIVA